MKINLNFLLAIIFFTLSIWLSFTVKQTKEKLFQSETQVIEMERKLGISKYQLEIMQEALALNIGKAPVPTRLTTQSRLTSNHSSPSFGNDRLTAVLYLKAHACSPCNMPVIEGLIKTGAGSGHFQVASHNSNRHFLQPVVQKKGIY